jgi:hypothetical protein
MKSSDTGTSFATTGTGLRLDPVLDPWFTARVTARSIENNHFIYDLVESWPNTQGFGYIPMPGGITVTGAWEINDSFVAVDRLVQARFRAYNGIRPTYEIWGNCCPSLSQSGSGSGGGTEGDLVTIRDDALSDVTGTIDLDVQVACVDGQVVVTVASATLNLVKTWRQQRITGPDLTNTILCDVGEACQ